MTATTATDTLRLCDRAAQAAVEADNRIGACRQHIAESVQALNTPPISSTLIAECAVTVARCEEELRVWQPVVEACWAVSETGDVAHLESARRELVALVERAQKRADYPKGATDSLLTGPAVCSARLAAYIAFDVLAMVERG